MKQDVDPGPAGINPSSRRNAVMALVATGFLAGCASQPPERGAARRSRTQPPPADRYALTPSHPDRFTASSAGSGRGISVRREAVVANAMLLINTPYKWGGNTPEGGFDCSGLVHYVFGRVMGSGHTLPRTTAAWADATTPIKDAQMEPGDLVFFNTSGRRFSHMGILIGDRAFVHAPSSGGRVHTTSLSNPYFSRRYLGARRVFSA
ncbi:MAG: C40 family peptidase [Ottowia sp.]|nr:C40 family peptidase [Ottowia sp.]